MSLKKSEQACRARVQILAEELYREQRPRLLAIARRHAANSADAEEALQETFAAFIRAYDPKGAAPPVAWLVLTLKRECWARRKRKHLEDRAGQETTNGKPGVCIAALPSQRAGTEEAIQRAEELLDARRRLAGLKPAERRALLMIGAGYSYREIGERCGWSYTKTNRCASEGRAKLRAPTD